uniref:Putative secreted protein n=1 Tax=Anopheles darlingi TaxID=43151 RepID=A0A2M4DFK8_ANODA
MVVLLSAVCCGAFGSCCGFCGCWCCCCCCCWSWCCCFCSDRREKRATFASMPPYTMSELVERWYEVVWATIRTSSVLPPRGTISSHC